jgi:hypothetical protein
MKLPEIWNEFSSGEWVSRRAWKKNVAIRVVNLKEASGHPWLMEDTLGFLYHFGGIQSPKMLRRVSSDRILYGLQHDLFADDWFVADQTQCTLTLKENEK